MMGFFLLIQWVVGTVVAVGLAAWLSGGGLVNRLLWSVGVLAASAFIWVYVIWTTEHVRFRVTVNVETPEGLRSGSSVIDVTIERRRFGTHDQHSPPHLVVRGVAPLVDLGRYGTLIALLIDHEIIGVARAYSKEHGSQFALDPNRSREVDLERYPIFMWLPPNAVLELDYKRAASPTV